MNNQFLGKLERFGEMLRTIWSEIKERPEILIWYWTYFFIREFTTLAVSFYVSWVGSFYTHSKDGQKEAVSTANDILFWANIASVPINLFSGFLADKVSYRIIFPTSTIVMGLGCGLIWIATHPYDATGIIGEILIFWGVTVHSLINSTFLLKRIGNKYRGPILLIGIFWGSVGYSFSGKLFGFLISKGSNVPYLFGMCYLSFYLLTIILLIVFGVFKS